MSLHCPFNPVFPLQVFLHPNTIAKINLVRGKKKIREIFDKHFSSDLSDWLMEEIKRNKSSSLPVSQREFWSLPPATETHDPRASPQYVRDYINPYKRTMQMCEHPLKVHNPHPNIIDALVGRLRLTSSGSGNSSSTSTSGSSSMSRSVATSRYRGGGGGGGTGAADNSDDSDDEDQNGVVEELQIPDDLQIPTDASPLHM